MARQQPLRTGRRVAISLLVLLAVLAALVGGLVLRQRQSAATYHHTPNAINTGNSLLYLSSPTFAAQPTQLTMVRTSDGALLWQYALHGVLTTSEISTTGDAIAAGEAVEIANGVIYFVVDPSPLGSPDRVQYLTALRATDGAVLWQRGVRGAFVELFGVSDGVICIRVTQQHGSALASSAVAGYHAATGSQVWQRQESDVVGWQVASYSPYSVVLLDGILYVTSGSPPHASPATVTVHALQANTGQTLWQYSQPGPASRALWAAILPMLADDGVVVLSSTASIGLRERDGTVLWRYQDSSTILANLPHGGRNGPGLRAADGILYFGSSTSGESLSLTALRLSTGDRLWRIPLGTGQRVLWDLAVGSSSVYAMTVPRWTGAHPSFDGLTLAAFDASSGTLRWQDRPAPSSFPYFAGTGDIVPVVSSTGIAGLRAADGAVLWQHSLTDPTDVTPAGGTAISL